MSCNEVFNWPHFSVPPEAPQVDLCLQRLDGCLDAPGWRYRDQQDEVRFSIAVYFGTLILYPSDPAQCGCRMRQFLALPQDRPLRLDYACTADRTLLLRAGAPGTKALPFSKFEDATLKEAEECIGAFLAQDFRAILLNRCCQTIDDDLLFEGETEFYEGFLGIDGLPLAVVENDGEPAAPLTVVEGGLGLRYR